MKKLIGEIGRFVIAGSLAAGANFFSRYFFQQYYPYIWSVGCAFIFGSFISFLLNRHFTFKAQRAFLWPQAFRFTVMALFSVVLAMGVASQAICMLNWVSFAESWSVHFKESVSHVASIVVNVIYNYICMKYYTFRSSSKVRSSRSHK